LTTLETYSKFIISKNCSGRKEMIKTFFPKKSEIQRKWYLIDAEGQILGRLAALIAEILTGKNKPTYTPFMDMGDHVVVINARKIILTGKKLNGKLYQHHTGYMGGLKEVKAVDLLGKFPERIIEKAVKGMLPHTKLGRAMFKKMKVYAGSEHPHEAQKPEPYPLEGLKQFEK
jgi:large subunit ribosomal protein L13